MVCDLWLVDCYPFCVFLCLLLVIVILIAAAKNEIVKAAFELQSSRVLEKNSNFA